MTETYISYPSPLGELTVAGDGKYITRHPARLLASPPEQPAVARSVPAVG